MSTHHYFSDWLIILCDGNFRFVSHDKRLATTGFSMREYLLKNAHEIRFDAGTLKLMSARYEKLFGSAESVS